MEVIENGTFEWKIDKFLESEVRGVSSPKFKVGRNTYDINISSPTINCLICSGFYNFYLIISKNDEIFGDGYIFKFCFIDYFEEEIFVTKHMNRKRQRVIPLLTISKGDFQLDKTELLPGDVLTIRLSWYKKLEQETQTTPDLISNDKGSLMLDTLSKDFTCFFESKEDMDCVLRVGDAKFPVHRAILSARSDVFAAMFRQDTSETLSGVVDIRDVEAGVMNEFLHYVYSGKVRGLSVDTAVPLYIVADKYAVIELRDFCRDFLMHNLMIGNVCDAAVLAHSHGEEELEKKVVQFIQTKMEEVQDSNEWKKFAINKPSLVIKLLSFTVMACNDKIKAMSSKYGFTEI